MNAPPALSRRGELLFDELRFTLAPAAPFESFNTSPLRARFGVHAAGDATICCCNRELVFASPFAVSLTFEHDKLTAAELFLHLAGDGRDWSSWSEAQEFKRKQTAEAWGGRVFGLPMDPMPIDVDGVAVIPEWEDRTPRHAIHTWGRVESFYDSKGGSSYLRIRYGQVPS